LPNGFGLELDIELSDYDRDREELGQRFEALQEKKRQLDSQIEEFARHSDVFCTKMVAFTSVIIEIHVFGNNIYLLRLGFKRSGRSVCERSRKLVLYPLMR